MKNREKILAILASAIVVIGIGKVVLHSIFLAPLENIESDIANVRKQIANKDRQMRIKGELIREWKGISKETLGDDPENVQRILLSRINTLITLAGLENVTKNPVPIVSERAGGVIKYYPVAININGRGRLEQITKFMEMLYNEPYTVKITGITLRTNVKKRIIAFSNCRIETIVLPKPAIDDVDVVYEKRNITATQPVPKIPDRTVYSKISEKNIFMPVLEQAVAKEPKESNSVGLNNKFSRTSVGGGNEYSSVGGKAGDVVGILVKGEKSGVYIRNRISIDWYNINDSLPGNLRLLFVHPLGIVVRDEIGRILFVEIGKNIYRPKELTAESCPELYEAYMSARRSNR